MSILVDSSVWIDYFRGSSQSDIMDYLIDENIIATNDLILTELIPALHIRNQKRLIKLLEAIKRYPIEIDWDDIRKMQITCIRKGVNGIGIPDLIITQNAIQNNLRLFSADGHFDSIAQYMPLSLYK